MQHNVKTVYRILKQKIIVAEEQQNIMRLKRQKRSSMIDLVRLTPGKGLLSLKEANLSENQIRGAIAGK